MKRYNRWFNFITSVIVDVVAGLFFIFASLPCYSLKHYLDPYNYYITSYSLYSIPGYGYYMSSAPIGMVFMYVFIFFSTASLIIDILHAAGPFRENKAYRVLHFCFSAICFGLLVTSLSLFSYTMSQTHIHYSPFYLALSCVIVVCGLEVARSVLGIVALVKGRRSEINNLISGSTEGKNNSDYAVKKLKDLKDLLSAGIISEEEYNEAKKKYIKDL